ncbi:MAG: RNB domain-containing ribonuclease [Zoogloeaceae bacterium]|jgi:exoribonuclease-2|nr:RNB domain-containing ribonuclease [Zoogloeaceae bacterium]
MYVLFEESGGLKAGSILEEKETTLQVEMISGKRVKLKTAQTLLRFASPAPAEIFALAEALSVEMDVDFLWEISPDDEFSFLALAADYFGHAPTPAEALAMLQALAGHPVHFHKRGKGNFRKAPPDVLAAALAAVEKKRRQAEAVEGWLVDLKAGRLPEALRAFIPSLFGTPDRNKPEIKALEAAAAKHPHGMPGMLLAVGAISSAYEWHLQRFLAAQFPKGTGFARVDAPSPPADLPEAAVAAFSIDDAATTEVDDALSIVALPDGAGWQVGIHIAAPGLAIPHGSPLDAIARARLSTVYMPGDKITMLPPEIVADWTLEGGKVCPAVSLYVDVAPDFSVRATQTKVERVPIAANLRHHEIEPWFNDTTLENGLPERPFKDELLTLWRFAKVLEEKRGKPQAAGINDYDFRIDGDLADPKNCRIAIAPRKRGSPLDTLVAELMILANSTWAGELAAAQVACLYRAQAAGKARMTTQPQPHEGINVPQYAWMTSPLRRYADLVCQQQLIAHVEGKTPPFLPRSAELFAAMRDFEQTYAAYADFQRSIERYWCLRWLKQEDKKEVEATVRRDELCRLDDVPLFVRIPGLAALPTGTKVKLAIDELDFLGIEARCRLLAAQPSGNETLSESEE